jgi:hypothetical protein
MNFLKRRFFGLKVPKIKGFTSFLPLQNSRILNFPTTRSEYASISILGLFLKPEIYN